MTEKRLGMTCIVNESGELCGVFTDGDLRRHILDENLLSQTMREVMTAGGYSVAVEALASEAVGLMQMHRIGELPVIDAAGQLVGHVALKDLVLMNFL
jgi:arabinose-5-phosphate isomerase